MEQKRVSNLVIENAKIIFRNFAGAEKRFNPAGRRNFCVVLDHDLAETLRRDGWNVKSKEQEDDDPMEYLQVTVAFGAYPPNIYKVTKRNKVRLDEDTVGGLDDDEIINVDLTIRPYVWEVNGKVGIKAYVKNMYVTIEEDAFAAKYDNPGNFESAGSDDEMPF